MRRIPVIISAWNTKNEPLYSPTNGLARISLESGSFTSFSTAVRHKQGRLLGRMEALGFSLRKEAELETLTLDVVKTSEIEGENLSAQQVRSAIARRLGMDIAGSVPADRNTCRLFPGQWVGRASITKRHLPEFSMPK